MKNIREEYIDGASLDWPWTGMPVDITYDETTDCQRPTWDEEDENLEEKYKRFVQSDKYLTENFLLEEPTTGRMALVTAMVATLAGGVAAIHNMDVNSQARRDELEANSGQASQDLADRVKTVKSANVTYEYDDSNIPGVTKAIAEAPTSFKEKLALAAMTIWAEARNQGTTGMHAVASVINNRTKVAKWHGDLERVVTADRQFSCWMPNDPNQHKMQNMIAVDKQLKTIPHDDPRVQQLLKHPEYKTWVEAKQIAYKMLTGQLKDITGGATYYHTTAIAPKWKHDKGFHPVKVIGNQVFYVNKNLKMLDDTE